MLSAMLTRTTCAASVGRRPAPSARAVSKRANSPPWASTRPARRAGAAGQPSARARMRTSRAFAGHESRDRRGDEQGVLHDGIWVNAQSDCDEKQTEEDVAEGPDLLLELVAEHTFAHDHAGKKGADR